MSGRKKAVFILPDEYARFSGQIGAEMENNMNIRGVNLGNWLVLENG